MRVTDRMLVDGALGALARSLEKLDRTQEMLTTGKRILRGSDDPVGASRVMTYRADLKRIDQYRSNMSRARSWLAQTDTALSGVNDLAVKASSIALAQGTATATTDTRTAAAAEVDGLIEEVMQLANSRYGTRYIFGGRRTGQAPFARTGDGVLYTGDHGAVEEELARGQYVQINVDGLSVFGNPACAVGGTAISPTPITRETTLESLGVTPGSIRIVNGSTEVQVDLLSAETIGDVLDEINASSAHVRASIDSAGTGITITNLLAGTNLQVSDVGVEQTATKLGIAGSAEPSGILGALLELKSALEADSTAQIHKAQRDLEDAMDGLLNVRASVGAKIARLEAASNRLDDEMIRLTQLLSDTEDADLTKLATDYAMQQTAYQTALAVTSRIFQPTLLDFMR